MSVVMARESQEDSSSAHSRWTNEQCDALLKEGRTTIHPEKRKDIYWRATAIMREEAPTIFLHQQHDLYGASKNFDWKPRPDQAIWLEGASIK